MGVVLKNNCGSPVPSIFADPLTKVVNKISPDLKESITNTIKDNTELHNMQEFQEVIGWIKESKLNQVENTPISNRIQNPDPISSDKSDLENNNTDFVFSGLANKIVENLMNQIPSYFGQLLIDNIRIQTGGIEKSVKLDIGFTMEPIKPYVEFVKKINGIEALRVKALFQIDSDVRMSDLEFLSDEYKKVLHFGNLLVHLKISLLNVKSFHNAISIDEPKELKEVEFEKDLSEIELSL